jgi:Flp pilus assembly protein TadD
MTGYRSGYRAFALTVLLGGCAHDGVQIVDVETAVKMAQAERASGDVDRAKEILQQVVFASPDDPRVMYEFARILLAEGALDDALAFLDRAVEVAPAQWSLHSTRGEVFLRKAMYPEARKAFARALELNPTATDVMNLQALAHFQTGDLASAESLLLEATRRGAPDRSIANNLAMVQRLRRAAQEPAASAPVLAAAPGAAAPSAAQTAFRTPEPGLSGQASSVTDTAPGLGSAGGAMVAMVDTSPVVTPAPIPSPPSGEPPASETAAPLSISVADASRVPASFEPAEPLPSIGVAAVEAPTAVAPGAEVQGMSVVATRASAKPAPPPARSRGQEVAGVTLPPGRQLYVQVASYATADKAGALADRLKDIGARVVSGIAGGKTVYRVRVMPLPTRLAAEEALKTAQERGFRDAFIAAIATGGT